MPGPFRSYANTVVGVLGGGGDPALTALLAAADGVDTALAAPALLADALEQWRLATDGLRDRLVSYVLAGVPANVLPGFDTDWLKPEGVRLKASVGPLSAQVDAPAVHIVDPRNASSPPIILGPATPKSLSAHLAAGPISGDGALNILPDGVNGILSLQLGVIEVAALASLRRIGDDPSFLAVMAAGFTPGIQLGFGFQISRLGGVVGINRTIDQPAISSKLRDGSASEALFPLDAGNGARRALAAVEVMLPPRLGSSVAGPTMRLSWLEIAGEGFCSLDLAVLIELPGPQRIVVVGVARAGIPPVLKLRIDVVGVIDFQRELIAIDASLIESGLLGIFTIYGDAAFRASWGHPSYTVVSVGGFYPGFYPEPAQIPQMRRLGFHLDVAVPGIDVRAEGYFAVTSNTVQLGGHFEAGIEAAGCGAHGFLDVDAIVQFSPFHIHAEVSAGFEVEVFGLTFCGVRLDGTLDGPGPVTIHGRLTVETFLKDFEFEETFTFGSTDAQPVLPPARAAQVLRDEEMRPGSLSAVGGPDRDVVTAPLPVPPGMALVFPRGGVAWQQKRVPLGIPIDRLDGVPLGGMQRVTASVVEQTSGSDDLFAPGSFITLTKAEALKLPAGVVASGGADVSGKTAPQAARPDQYRKVRDEPWGVLDPALMMAQEFPGILLAMVAARDAPSAVATLVPLVTVDSEAWVSTSDGAVHASATGAHQAAKVSGQTKAFAVAAADIAAPVALGGL